MKKLSDEQIQAMLDDDLMLSGDLLSGAEQQGLESYRSLFQKLNNEPEQGLPFNFASKVTGELKVRLKKRSDIRFNLFALLGIIGGLAIVYYFLTVVDFNSGSRFLLAMLKFKWLLILGTFTLLGTLIFDQRVVEKN